MDLVRWICLRVFGQVDLVMWILTGSIMLYLRKANLVFCVLSETTGEPRNISSLLLYLPLFLQCAVRALMNVQCADNASFVCN